MQLVVELVVLLLVQLVLLKQALLERLAVLAVLDQAVLAVQVEL